MWLADTAYITMYVKRSHRKDSDVAFKIISQWQTICVETIFSNILLSDTCRHPYGGDLFVAVYIIDIILRAAHHGRQ
jgi:hypothetical protein